MKKLVLTLLVSLVLNSVYGQAPSNYYDGTAGLSGASLKSKLKTIITNGHQDNGYGNLLTAFQSTDRDYFYENDGTVMDMYSENPTGTDPYIYNHGVKQCGNYSVEGDCYNREHVVPQSLFNQNLPMRSDVHFVTPTDGKVNGMRSNYPFGKVGSTSFTSLNGSKLGSSVSAGYAGTVFEPIDEFKGDIARMILYFVTRYETQLSGFSSGNILGSTAYPGLQTWELKQLLEWNNLDPVSPFEIARNNAAFTYQGNRNPYIDRPEFVALIWGAYMGVADVDLSKSLVIVPNPVKDNKIYVLGGKNLGQYKIALIYNMTGQLVQTIENPFQKDNTIILTDLPKGIYILITGDLNTKFIIK